MAETERAPLEAGGAEGALLAMGSEIRWWLSLPSVGSPIRAGGSAWRALAESDHPVTGGAVFCVIFCREDRGIRPCAGGKDLNSRVGLDDGDIFSHAAPDQSSKFLGRRGLSAF